jgi:hypothetical protein
LKHETVFVVFVCFHYLLITCDSSPLGQERGAHTGMDVLQEPLDIRPFESGFDSSFLVVSSLSRSIMALKSQLKYIEITEAHQKPMKPIQKIKKMNTP